MRSTIFSLALSIGLAALSACDAARPNTDENGVQTTGDGRTVFMNGTQPGSSSGQSQPSGSFWGLFPGSYRTTIKSGYQAEGVSVTFGSETLQGVQYGRLKIAPYSVDVLGFKSLDLYLILTDFHQWDASTISYTIQSNIVLSPQLVSDHMAVQFDAVFRYTQANGWKFDPASSWLTIIDCAYLVCDSVSHEAQFTEALK